MVVNHALKIRYIVRIYFTSGDRAWEKPGCQ